MLETHPESIIVHAGKWDDSVTHWQRHLYVHDGGTGTCKPRPSMPTRRQVVLPPERTISPPFAPSHAATASTHRLVSVVRTRPRLTGDACAADGVNLFGSWRRTRRICSKTVSPRQPARGVSSSPIRSVGLAPSEPPKARVLQRTPSALSPGPPHPRTHPIEWAECVESQVRPPPHAARPSRTPAPTGGRPSLAGCDAFYHSCEDCVAAAPDEEDTDTLEPEA